MALLCSVSCVKAALLLVSVLKGFKGGNPYDSEETVDGSHLMFIIRKRTGAPLHAFSVEEVDTAACGGNLQWNIG